MCKEIVEKIYELSEKCGTNKIAVVTNHLKVTGTLCVAEEKDDEDYMLTLTDAKMWRLEDICTCKEPNCKCDESTFCPVGVLHVNLKKMVGYSLICE